MSFSDFWAHAREFELAASTARDPVIGALLRELASEFEIEARAADRESGPGGAKPSRVLERELAAA